MDAREDFSDTKQIFSRNVDKLCKMSLYCAEDKSEFIVSKVDCNIWIYCGINYERTGATTAQVTPLELTNKMMNAAIEKGAELIFGAVEGVDIIEGKVTGVRVTGKQLIKQYDWPIRHVLTGNILIQQVPSSYDPASTSACWFVLRISAVIIDLRWPLYILTLEPYLTVYSGHMNRSWLL